MKKYWHIEQLMDKFDRLSYKKKYDILYQALGYIQSYNGRSTDDCIALAMGYEYEEDSMYFKPPM